MIFEWETDDKPFETKHFSFEEMAEEIVDAVVLARLDGHPMLPLEVG